MLPRELGNPGHLARSARRFLGVLCGHDAPFWAQAAASRAVSKAEEQFAVRKLLLDSQSAVLCPHACGFPPRPRVLGAPEAASQPPQPQAGAPFNTSFI